MKLLLVFLLILLSGILASCSSPLTAPGLTATVTIEGPGSKQSGEYHCYCEKLFVGTVPHLRTLTIAVPPDGKITCYYDYYHSTGIIKREKLIRGK